MNILSIDIGISNLAVVNSKLSPNFDIETVTHCDRCDIRTMCLTCTNKNCVLKHEKTPVDWVNHLVLFKKKIFYDADIILIERQPPGGLKDIEVLLFQKFREKVIMINPRSMHAWMGISRLDYESRKRETEKAAEIYVKNTKAWEINSERRHDIADAVCFTLFHASKLKEEEENQKSRELVAPEFVEFIESFSYDDLGDTPLICYNDKATFSTVWLKDKEFCNYIADTWYLPRKEDNTMSKIEKNTTLFKDWILKKKTIQEHEQHEEHEEHEQHKKPVEIEPHLEPIRIEDYAWQSP